MRFLSTRTDPPEAVAAALTQSVASVRADAEASVREIVEDVRARGDAAVRDYLRRFDGVEVERLEVTPEELAAAEAAVNEEFRQAVALAAERVRSFHEHQARVSWRTTDDGAELGQIVRPLERVGVHVPAGQVPLPSSLLMAAIPARVAGVPEVIVASTPRKDGTVDPHTLVAARAAEVTRVFKMGGPHGVAALAYGTESVPRVDKVVGPGGPYTVLAKRLVFGTVGIESLPGPTEIVVVADEGANPRWVAADLLSQAEHAEDSSAILITPSEALGRAVAAEVERQTATLSRAEIVRACLAEHGWIIVCRDLAEACELSDRCAPEHVELMVREPEAWVERLHHAGAILVGDYTPESVGDYIAGPSHILPTSGTARFSSPLNVDDFVKKTSLLRYDRDRFLRDAPHVIAMATAERLDGHANAIRVRLEDLGGE